MLYGAVTVPVERGGGSPRGPGEMVLRARSGEGAPSWWRRNFSARARAERGRCSARVSPYLRGRCPALVGNCGCGCGAELLRARTESGEGVAARARAPCNMLYGAVTVTCYSGGLLYGAVTVPVERGVGVVGSVMVRGPEPIPMMLMPRLSTVGCLTSNVASWDASCNGAVVRSYLRLPLARWGF